MSRQYFAPLTEEKTELEKMSATEAEEHFWAIPELVEYLLPFLDAISIASLACVHKPTTKILQGSSILREIIRRNGLPFDVLNEETLEQHRIGIRRLVMLFLKMENKKSLLIDLLHVVLWKCPIAENSRRGVKVRCSTPGHIYHSVSPCGIVLLEEAEASFGSAEQRVVKIVNHDLKNSFLTALGSRLLRQEEVEVSLEMRIVECRNISHVRAFFTLMQKCQVNLDHSM